MKIRFCVSQDTIYAHRNSMSVSQLQVPLHALEHIQSTSLIGVYNNVKYWLSFYLDDRTHHLGNLRLSTLLFRISNPCCNPTFLGSATTATTSTAESQPATVCTGPSNNQPATSAVYHLTDAPGPAGWAPP